jgi:hypothetical protein
MRSTKLGVHVDSASLCSVSISLEVGLMVTEWLDSLGSGPSRYLHIGVQLGGQSSGPGLPGYSRTSISGIALSGEKPERGRFLCVLTRFTDRVCNVQRDYPASVSFTRVCVPPAYRTSTTFGILIDIG